MPAYLTRYQIKNRNAIANKLASLQQSCSEVGGNIKLRRTIALFRALIPQKNFILLNPTFHQVVLNKISEFMNEQIPNALEKVWNSAPQELAREFSYAWETEHLLYDLEDAVDRLNTVLSQ